MLGRLDYQLLSVLLGAHLLREVALEAENLVGLHVVDELQMETLVLSGLDELAIAAGLLPASSPHVVDLLGGTLREVRRRFALGAGVEVRDDSASLGKDIVVKFTLALEIEVGEPVEDGITLLDELVDLGFALDIGGELPVEVDELRSVAEPLVRLGVVADEDEGWIVALNVPVAPVVAERVRLSDLTLLDVVND